jgi:hypothetical protein
MKTVFTILVALAAVTFPIYLVVFIFKSLVLGLMAALVTVIWVIGQIFMKLNIFSKQEQNNKQIPR